jgi:hypothetical protein
MKEKVSQGLYGGATIPCKWCNKLTPYLATQHCNPCWELYWEIKSNPELAKRMLKELSK